MNLSAYDSVNVKSDFTISPTYKTLYAIGLDYRYFYTFLKKYNVQEQCNDYFVVLSNSTDKDNDWKSVYYNKQKRLIKFNLNSIWNDIARYVPQFIAVDLKLIDGDEDCEIYKIVF